MEVLWETARPGDGTWLWSGLTDNYLRVTTSSAENLHNIITPTRLLAERDNGLYGEVEPPQPDSSAP